MPGVNTNQIGDLLASVYNDVPLKKWVDIAQTYNSYIVMPTLLKRKKMIASGPQMDYKIQTGYNDTSRQTKLFQADDLSRSDYLITATVPWTHYDTHTVYDEREWASKLPNYSNQDILDYMEVQDHAMIMGSFDHFEEQFFGRPTDANDDLNSWGLKYWLTRHITGTSDSATGGLNGGPAFGSTVAGINTTTYENWNNRTFKYTNVTVGDLITRLGGAMDYCDFGRPRAFNSVDGNTPDWKIWMGNTEFTSFKTLAKAQNEDIGADLDAFHNRVMFRGAKVEWVPILDDDTDDPVFVVDLSTFDFKVQKGRDFVRTFQKNLHGAHNVSAQWLDATYNFCCYNRRRNAVLCKTAANL